MKLLGTADFPLLTVAESVLWMRMRVGEEEGDLPRTGQRPRAPEPPGWLLQEGEGP